MAAFFLDLALSLLFRREKSPAMMGGRIEIRAKKGWLAVVEALRHAVGGTKGGQGQGESSLEGSSG